MIEAAEGKSPRDSIYVLLTDTGTMFTRLIKRFTSAPYNHASLALDVELNDLYSFGRKHAAKPWAGGFVKEDIYEGTYSYFPGTQCALLRLRVTKEQRAQTIRVIRSFQREKELYRYNLVGLLGVVMKRGIEPKKAYFCSQFVSETLRSSGVSLWDQPSTLVTPDDFYSHSAFELVYEGFLYDYPLLDGTRLVFERSKTVTNTSFQLGGKVV
ncbi:hypothetical protein PATA110616_06025 [Paenibacillus tarimensis]